MKENKRVWIYTLSDPRNGLIKYVGKTSRVKKRIGEHIRELQGNTKKINWIKSLKKTGLNPIFEEIEETDVENCDFLEMYWISQFKTWGFELKNHTDGGDGSYGIIPWNKGMKGVFKHSEESKNKMSKWRKKNTIGNKNGFYGKKHSEENKKKWSDLGKKRKWSEDFKENRRGTNSVNCKKIYCYSLDGNLVKVYDFGLQVAEDGFDSNMVSKCCRKIHKTHKRHIFSHSKIEKFNKDEYVKKVWNKGLVNSYTHSDETKIKMSLSKKGKKININNSGENNPNSKKIYCYDSNVKLIKIYEYIKKVEDDGLNYHIVRKRCKNKSLKPYKGFIFSSDLLNK